MANETTITLTPVESSTPGQLSDLATELQALGPKRVKGKEFEAEQFDPLAVSKLLERNSTSHPTFGSMTKTKVISKRAQQDICPGEGGSCSCR